MRPPEGGQACPMRAQGPHSSLNRLTLPMMAFDFAILTWHNSSLCAISGKSRRAKNMHRQRWMQQPQAQPRRKDTVMAVTMATIMATVTSSIVTGSAQDRVWLVTAPSLRRTLFAVLTALLTATRGRHCQLACKPTYSGLGCKLGVSSPERLGAGRSATRPLHNGVMPLWACCLDLRARV